jgi:hypothetical protein
MKMKHIQFAVIGYAIAGLICFGPAAVEEDALEAVKKAECEAHRAEVYVYTCKFWARNEFRPLVKSMFWPLWLSYRAAATIKDSHED